MVLRCFLDTNAWNYLCPVQYEGATPPDASERLVRSVRARTIEVLSSATVLEEVMGAARSHPDRYAAMTTLMFATVEHRWLLPLNERVIAEAAHGGPIPESSRYLPEDVVSDMRAEAAGGDGIALVADEVHAQGAAFEREQSAIRAELRTTAAAEGADLEHTVERWWSGGSVIAEWVSDLITSASTKGRVAQEARAGRDDAPSLWWFVAYRMARIKLNLADNRATKASDYLDADHYSCGPYCDLLVTNDKALHETAALLPQSPFAVETFEDLLNRLVR